MYTGLSGEEAILSMMRGLHEEVADETARCGGEQYSFELLDKRDPSRVLAHAFVQPEKALKMAEEWMVVGYPVRITRV